MGGVLGGGPTVGRTEQATELAGHALASATTLRLGFRSSEGPLGSEWPFCSLLPLGPRHRGIDRCPWWRALHTLVSGMPHPLCWAPWCGAPKPGYLL
jgi:hypothetical protein